MNRFRTPSILDLEIFCQGSYIIQHYIVSLKDSFYIIGGDSGPLYNTYTDKIVAFSTETKQWTKVGKLKTARSDHRVFGQLGDFVVVGGSNSALSTERCIVGESVQCTAIKERLLAKHN